MALPAKRHAADGGEPPAGGTGGEGGGRDGPSRRRTFMAGRRGADGSCVWFFPEAGEAAVAPFPGPWTLSLVVRTG